MIRSSVNQITGRSHDQLHRIARTVTSKTHVEHMLMHVAGTFPDNYVYGKYTYYIWEYGEIGENNTYLCTDHLPQVYIPCRISHVK